MSQDANDRIITVDELDKADDFIKNRQSFVVRDIANMSRVVKDLERKIEENNFTCRIYTSKRAAAMALGAIPTPATVAAGVGTAVAIAAHNIATFNPDFVLEKYIVDKRIEVRYEKGVSK